MSKDFDSIRRLDLRAFGDASKAELAERIRASNDYVAELALVGEQGGEVVAHAIFSHVALEAHETFAVLALALLAVDPRTQQRGLGGQLVRAGLAAADVRGDPLVVVEGDHAYYSRFGFEPSSRHGIDRPLRHVIPEPNFMVRRLSRYDDRYRGHIVLPHPFDVIVRGANAD